MVTIQELEGWEGNAEDLADLAGPLLRERGFAESPVSPNARLIRDYGRRSILSRPERRGKEAIYRFRHLIEFVAARVLVADGWPLAKLAEHFVHSSDMDLLALIPSDVRSNRALAAARELMRRNRKSDPNSRSPQEPASQTPSLPSAVFRERVARVSGLQSELHSFMAGLGLPPGAPPVEQVSVIFLSPWCHLFIASARLKALTPDEAEDIGRAVTANLLNPKIRKEIP